MTIENNMATSIKNVCRRNSTTGERKHQMRTVQDGHGRAITRCEDCGMVPVKTQGK